jgi:hypothetical protein
MLSLAFMGCMSLAVKDGSKPLAELPDRTYRRQVGDWTIAITDQPNIRALVDFRGTPAGLITVSGGAMVGDASENLLIEAIEKELGESIESWSRKPPSSSLRSGEP